jgi:hypothetical protein
MKVKFGCYICDYKWVDNYKEAETAIPTGGELGHPHSQSGVEGFPF